MKKGNVDTERKRDKEYVEVAKKTIKDTPVEKAKSTAEVAEGMVEKMSGTEIKESTAKSKLSDVKKVLKEQGWPIAWFESRENRGKATHYFYDKRTEDEHQKEVEE